jgi:hypothetical protein
LVEVPQGLKPLFISPFSARLKSCPDTGVYSSSCTEVVP